MSSGLPEPGSRFSGTLRVVKRGESEFSSGMPTSPPPIQPGSSGMGFLAGWTLFRITVWATIAVWVYPHLLDWVGGQGAATWLIHHRWVRMLCGPPLGILGLISAFEVRNTPRQRAAREELAGGMGGTVTEEPRLLDPTLGFATGPALRLPVGHWSMTVNSWKHRGQTRTVATVSVEARSSFSFIAHGTAREPRILRGLQQQAAGYLVRRMEEQTNDPRAAAAAATLAYLAEPPIAIGDAALDGIALLRSNQPDTARALLRAGEVARTIVELNARSRFWEWTLYPAATAGTGEMRLECPGDLKGAESVRPLQAVLQAALEELVRSGVISG